VLDFGCYTVTKVVGVFVHFFVPLPFEDVSCSGPYGMGLKYMSSPSATHSHPSSACYVLRSRKNTLFWDGVPLHAARGRNCRGMGAAERHHAVTPLTVWATQ
jgi:hypothetical protein